MAPVVICKKCGEAKQHHALGFCKVCYNREWRYANPYKRYQQRVRYKRRRAWKRAQERSRALEGEE